MLICTCLVCQFVSLPREVKLTPSSVVFGGAFLAIQGPKRVQRKVAQDHQTGASQSSQTSWFVKALFL